MHLYNKTVIYEVHPLLKPKIQFFFVISSFLHGRVDTDNLSSRIYTLFSFLLLELGPTMWMDWLRWSINTLPSASFPVNTESKATLDSGSGARRT